MEWICKIIHTIKTSKCSDAGAHQSSHGHEWFVHVLMAAVRMKLSVASIPCLLTGTALGIREK
jgi:hypothetical protein